MDGKGKLELGNGGTGGRQGTLPTSNAAPLPLQRPLSGSIEKKWQFSLSLSDDMGNLGPWPRRAVWKLAIFGLPISAVLNTDEVEGWKICFFSLGLRVFFDWLIDWLIDWFRQSLAKATCAWTHKYESMGSGRWTPYKKVQQVADELLTPIAVSYTHLTLPTILRV